MSNFLKSSAYEQQANDGRRCAESPGPVKPNEIVALGLYHPDLIDITTRKICKEALKSESLMKQEHVNNCGDSSGLSVARVLDQDSVEQLKKTVLEIASRPAKNGSPRIPVGHAKISVSWLSGNHVSVLDDGKIGFASHAVLRTEMSRAEARRLREDMRNELQKTVVAW